MDSFDLKDKLLNQKFVYPYEYFNCENINNHLQHKKENYWSTLTQSYAKDEDIERTKEINNKFGFQDG